MPSAKGPVRIGGASGGFADRQRAITDLAKSGLVDVIIGDWMSECTMTIHGSSKIANNANSADPKAAVMNLYDPSFMGSLAPALAHLQRNGVRLAVNAGASAPERLARVVREEVDRQGLNLKVAWVEGDDVTEQVMELRGKGEEFVSLDTGKRLDEWGHEPICAQCYLGGMGIAAALRAGADIVICGRVADASPAVGAAAWWHNWDPATDLDGLAGALVAGHIIECSTYATGGYYSGFKSLFDGCENLGYPIAAVEATGDAVFSKEEGTGGEVSVGTLTSQLVYEIQGPVYYNSDVAARLEGVRLEQVGKDLVRMTGVTGIAPPPTTKVGITARGGYQAEFHYLFVGLDVAEKAAWTERQVRYAMRDHVHKFSKLKFHVVGSPAQDPKTQDSATVDLRIFVQTEDPSILGVGSWASLGGADSFTRWCMQNFLTSAPGASIVPDSRQSSGKPVFEYWPTLLPQSAVRHRAVLEWTGEAIDVPSPAATAPYRKVHASYDTESPADLATFGPTTRGPLGWVVMGRSGDKASDANVGFFVRHDDEWDWLRSLLSTDKLIELLGAEYLGHGVDRFEMAHLRAVHFLVHDHLDRGFNATSSLDALGKNLCEFLRAKWVDIPDRFLARGKI